MDTVLVVDPDTERRERTIAALDARLEGAFLGHGSIRGTLPVVDERTVEWVVAENELPDGTGLELFEAVRDRSPDAACVLFTADSPEEIDTGPTDGQAVEYLPRDRSAAVDRLVELFRGGETLRAQTSYPFPDGEDARLATLETLGHDVDRITAPLDRLTGLVADHLDVRAASVNLIREHTQEFLTCHGVDWPSTEREESICTFTIAADQRVMAVPDVSEDPRFADVEGLDELGVRAYMGATLTVEGHPLGTLCVYDDHSREFSATERDALQRFADVAVDIVELYCDLQRVDGSTAEEPR